MYLSINVETFDNRNVLLHIAQQDGIWNEINEKKLSFLNIILLSRTTDDSEVLDVDPEAYRW